MENKLLSFFLIMLFFLPINIYAKDKHSDTFEIEKLNITSMKTLKLKNILEPSGIIFHPLQKTFFVVGDEGDIVEMDRNGEIINKSNIIGMDMEGITVHPLTGLLYAVVEGEDMILEINPDTFTVLRYFSINRKFDGKLVLDPDGNGLEGITFVYDEKSPESGTFYIANQSDNKSKSDKSLIMQVELPLLSSSKKYNTSKNLNIFFQKISDISDIYYLQKLNTFFCISDNNNLLFIWKNFNQVLHYYRLPGKNQEGFTIDDQGTIYLTMDTGDVLVIILDQRFDTSIK